MMSTRQLGLECPKFSLAPVTGDRRSGQNSRVRVERAQADLSRLLTQTRSRCSSELSGQHDREGHVSDPEGARRPG